MGDFAGVLSAKEMEQICIYNDNWDYRYGSIIVVELLKDTPAQGLETYTRVPQYGQEFGARVFKISRDEQGNRLTHLKVTGGILKVKQQITGQEEKVNQIRLYSGAGFEAAAEAEAGTVCAVTGLNDTFAGQGLGAEKEAVRPILEPVLTYEIQLPEGCDVHKMLLSLHQLEEEEPMLHILWQEELGEIHAQVMGQVQMEILKHQILERFGAEVEFGAGNIVYKETILEPAEGVGHYEPLRHYAEVHLLLEPGEPGSGLQFDTVCSEDVLDRNWQRLILTHLMEKKHRGVLTGSEITDMKITLLTGRAHLKHTEGGDFRQATYRAVRQGLRSAWCALLEPVYAFRLEIPADKTGRAMADIQRMQGTFDPPEQSGELAILIGTAPVVAMRDYAQEVTAYTKGSGRLTCTLKGYERCHNEAEVLEAYAYDPEADLQNPTGSVFCAHGQDLWCPGTRCPIICMWRVPLGKSQEKRSGQERWPRLRISQGAEHQLRPFPMKMIKSCRRSLSAPTAPRRSGELHRPLMLQVGRGGPAAGAVIFIAEQPDDSEPETEQTAPAEERKSLRERTICWWTATILSLPGRI